MIFVDFLGQAPLEIVRALQTDQITFLVGQERAIIK